MRRRWIWTIAALCWGLGALLPTAAAEVPTGEELMRRVNQRPRGETSRMRLRMMFRDAKRGDFEKRVLRLSRQFSDGHRTVFQMTAPEHEEGIGLLLREGRSLPGMWMYFPRSDHLVRVASRGLSALASDFSCEDLLVEVPLADYELRNLGRGQVDGHPAFQVEMSPRTDALRRELGFHRSVGWIREDLWMIVRAEYYDRSGNVFKTFEIDEIERIQDIWTPRRYSMDNHRARHATEVTVLEVRYGAALPAALFEPEHLSQPYGAGATPSSSR